MVQVFFVSGAGVGHKNYAKSKLEGGPGGGLDAAFCRQPRKHDRIDAGGP